MSGRKVTPTGRLVTNAAPETCEWFDARRGGITGTDLPKILGYSRYGNALSVWLDKRGELQDTAGEAARWGSLIEDVVAREWTRRHNNTPKLQRIGVVADERDPWRRASLDRVVFGCPDAPHQGTSTRDCGLEIKTRSAFKASEWGDGIPDDVLAQVAWGRLVTGLDHMHVAVLIGGQKMQTFRYDPDPAIEAFLIAQAQRIQDCVTSGIPPEVDPDGDGVLLSLLEKMHTNREGARELSEDALLWLAKYREAQAEATKADRAKTEAKTALLQMLGDGEIAEHDGIPLFTYIAGKPSEVVTSDALKALKENDPATHAALVEAGVITTRAASRTFRLKTTKKEATA